MRLLKMHCFERFLRPAWRCLAATVCLALPAAGCGVSEYESRMDETIQTLKLQNQFVVLGRQPKVLADPDKQVGVNVLMRVPQQLDGVLLMRDKSEKPESPGTPMNEDRLKPPAPPLVGIPGYQVTLEQFGISTQGTRPFYLYVGVEPLAGNPQQQKAAAAAGRDQVLATLKANLTEAFKERVNDQQAALAQIANWAPVKLSTPDPKVTEQWYELKVTCTQMFEVRGNVGSGVPGTFLLMAHEVPGYQVFLGWRIVVGSKDHDSFLAAAHAAAGTLSPVVAIPVNKAPGAP